ncbi:Flp family type IVb pilin [Herbaspirillum sp. HC18]|nr:Flp family type IVb pilin [Herbaspirillum sp. HC18]
MPTIIFLGELMNAIKRFLKDEEGAVAIEYALLAGLLAIAIAVGASALGKDICGFFNAIGTAITNKTFTLGTVTACA